MVTGDHQLHGRRPQKFQDNNNDFLTYSGFTHGARQQRKMNVQENSSLDFYSVSNAPLFPITATLFYMLLKGSFFPVVMILVIDSEAKSKCTAFSCTSLVWHSFFNNEGMNSLHDVASALFK